MQQKFAECSQAALKPRLLIFIVAYHAEATIENVLSRIPPNLADNYYLEVLIIDDSSADKTFEVGLKTVKQGNFPFAIHVLFNPVNQGYGGNQKIGYHYAVENKFDFVALLHGDGQYAPECLQALLVPLSSGDAEAVFGSRMLSPGQALKGGMPLYKYVGNKILTWFSNRMLKSNLSEFHSGYRVYSVSALKNLPFDLNTNDFHFDTEIIIQLMFAKLRIVELPIPTYYGDEICRVNGMRYALDVVVAVTKAKAQWMGLLYSANYDCEKSDNRQYQLKLNYRSPHSELLRHISAKSNVLDLGCAGGYVGVMLKQTIGCNVTGVDCFQLDSGNILDAFVLHDLNEGIPSIDLGQFEYILLLDVLEHLAKPENFIRALRKRLELHPNVKVIASSGNVAFFIPRLMLLLGQFNYGKRGILDMTHCRLFTFTSFRSLFAHNGFQETYVAGMPGPFPLAIGDNLMSKLLLILNNFSIKFSRGFFSYQIFLISNVRPSLALLLSDAIKQSEIRVRSLTSDVEELT